jgi:hypothetical protein
MGKKKKKKKFKYKNHEKKAQQQSNQNENKTFDVQESVKFIENKKPESLDGAEQHTQETEIKTPDVVKSDRNNKRPFIVFAIVVVLVILGFVFLGGKKDDVQNETLNLEGLTEEEAAKRMAEMGVQELVVLEDFENTVRDGRQTDAARVALERSGEIATAQIHVLASSDGAALDQWSSAYVKLQTRDVPRGIGGHLVQDNSIITSDSTEESLYVYDMDLVSFRPLGASPEIDTANWLETMNNYDEFRIYAFTSTLGAGVIEKIIINYTCVEESDCSITLAE